MNTTPPRFKDAKMDDVPQGIRDLIEAGKSIYLYGAVGTGKTHIAYAVANSRDDVLVCNTTELLREMRQDISRESTDKKRWDDHLMTFKGVVVLDDVGSEKISDWVIEAFYLIIQKRYVNMLPTMLTSNLPIGDLAERIGDRTASRIAEMAEIVELVGKDRRLMDKKKITVNV